MLTMGLDISFVLIKQTNKQKTTVAVLMTTGSLGSENYDRTTPKPHMNRFCFPLRFRGRTYDLN